MTKRPNKLCLAEVEADICFFRFCFWLWILAFFFYLDPKLYGLHVVCTRVSLFLELVLDRKATVSGLQEHAQLEDKRDEFQDYLRKDRNYYLRNDTPQ